MSLYVADRCWLTLVNVTSWSIKEALYEMRFYCMDFSHLSLIEKNAINDPGVIQLIYHFKKLYGNGIKSTKEPMIYFLEGQ